MQGRKPHGATAVFAFSIIFVLALAIIGKPAQAQKFEVLHTFRSGDGPQVPSGQLILDAEGNLYGVAGGGTGRCSFDEPCGTVFKMNKTGALVRVYSFKTPGSGGNEPFAGLLRDATGNLFGVTLYGGVNTKACSDNVDRICGVVFEVDPSGKKETVLHKFTNNPDGMVPESLLIDDSAGNLYGTTYMGGSGGLGTVFKVNRAGEETVLFNFFSFYNAAFPYGGVVADSAGNLYGTTGYGGTYDCNGGGCGTVYELDAGGDETVLYNFTGESDGYSPWRSLTWDAAGNLYGVALYGGNETPICTGGEGCGTVYKLSPNSNGTWTETTLYEFCPGSSCTDGSRPNGPVIRDAAGNLYGTTSWGGSSPCYENLGCGVVFKLDTAGHETVLHSFTGGADGKYPSAGLTMDASGSLYGVAGFGGDNNCKLYGDTGCGVVFKIAP